MGRALEPAAPGGRVPAAPGWTSLVLGPQRPTTVGEAQIHGIVEQLTDPSQQELIDTLGDELANNIGAIIEAAEAEDAIRVEPEGVLDQLGREWERANDWRNYVPLYQ